MTDPNPDLDERLARLAQRKASSRATSPNRRVSAAATVATTPTEIASINPGTPVAPAKRARRRHPAAAGRILSVGLSSSAFLSMVAAFGSQPASGASGAVAATVPKKVAVRAAPRPKIVIKDVHHVTYVDQWGRPVAAPSIPTGIASVPGASPPAAGSGPKNSGGARTPGAPASWPSAPSGTPPPGPTPGAGGGATSSPSGPANPPPGPNPAPGPAPGPAPTTPHVTPGPTTPPVTSAPTTVVTTPPPPPPPACTGSKCP